MPMMGGFHAGELTVQTQAGVLILAQRLAGNYRREFVPEFDAFLRAQPFVVLAALDPAGWPWVSALSGAPGFARAVDRQTVRVSARLELGDPLFNGLNPDSAIGLLAIDLASRGRIRVNGKVTKLDDGLEFRTEQVYSNCPQYIQTRDLRPSRSVGTPTGQRSSTLTEHQIRWLQQTDTFFIASADPEGGADASHRGGQPGFVTVDGPQEITWPDYVGNNLFNTLGNIESTGRAGLLLINFATGDTLQLTGRARIDWDVNAINRIPGAQRLVRFEVEAIIERTGAFGLIGPLVEYSSDNPAIVQGG